ncbi:hypothetical protein GGX14DRAFT_699840 [Mycena pura]|uniref:Uncharacterized protein n=1 Tax=Mycena pura TaxID=153505 RepID=A0AAD6V488_9AGAR|nr:hypothetical protein GGX14DRAFT_699840 [Mycena pura]
MADVTFPFANLLSLTLASLFYGMYFVLFFASMYLFLNRGIGPRGSASTPLLMKSIIFISSCALFLAVTVNWVMVVYRNFLGFIFFEGGLGAATFFNSNAQISETVQNVFLSLSVAFGDSMIIYRLWVVWSNLWIIIPPIMSLLGLLISLVITIIETPRLSTIAEDTGITPITVFTLVTNVYCTGFISWKIYKISQAAKGLVSSPISLPRVTAIIVESAAIYTSWVIFYTVTHQLNRNVQFAAQNSLPAVVGIANSLIYARVGLGRAIENSSRTTGSMVTSPATVTMRFPPASSDAAASDTDSYGMQDIAKAAPDILRYDT